MKRRKRRERASRFLEPINVLARQLFTPEHEAEIQRKNTAALRWAVTEGRKPLP